LPIENGPSLMRVGTVKYLEKNGFDVTVITPNYNKQNIEKKKNAIYFPFTFSSFIGLTLEKIGIFDDYMDLWVKNVCDYLIDKVDRQCIIFTTSGGELGCIKLGYLLKKTLGCKFVIHFHDPISHSYVNGVKNSKMPHVRREPTEYKFYHNADFLITTSEYYKKALVKKFPDLESKIIHNYFGYLQDEEQATRPMRGNISIAYGGAMSKIQSPELLAKAASDLDGVDVYYMGKHKQYRPLDIFRDKCQCMETMFHSQYLDFMKRNIDIGFVSLAGDYFGACVPSKIYEYINLGLPMLGALPDGDAKDIINTNGFGIACHYRDVDGLRRAILKMKDNLCLQQIKSNVLEHREKWSMENRFKEILPYITKVI